MLGNKLDNKLLDYDDATELDNIAYKFYIIDVYKTASMDMVYYTQKGFIGSVECEEFYKKAKEVLRGVKLKKNKDGIKI